MRVSKIYDWWAGGSSSPTFSSSTERCVLAGGPTGKFYITFGGGVVHPTTYDEVSYWRFATNHNSNADGDARIITKSFGSDTIYGPTTVYADPDGAGTINVTNVSGNWGNNNRFILFWLEINGTTGDLYYKYSDDLYTNITTPASATWSARTRMTTDFGTGQANIYIDGPGEFITLQNGNLLKPCWCNNGIVTTYLSTNNGLTWTRSGNITLDTINPCDETAIVQLDNGTIFAAVRCNSLAVIRTSTSTDNGVTWSALVSTSIPSYGKPGLTQYQNNIFGIAREYVSGFTSNRTIYFKSSNLTTFEYGFLDNRLDPYMYGKPNYSVGENKIITYYSVEGANIDPLAGPTRIIRKESTLTVAAAITPVAYNNDYQSLLDFTQAAGETLPSDANKLVDSAFAAAVDSDPIDGYYVVKHNNAALSDFSLRNWRKSWIKATSTGTYGITGWDFNGTSQFFDPLLQLNLQAEYLQDDAEVTFYTEEEGTTTGVEFGGNTGTFASRNNPVMMELRFTTNAAFFAINGPGTLSTVANTTAAGLWELKRTSSTTIELWKNGVLFASASTTSTGRASVSPIVGAERFGNGNFLFNPRSFGLLAIGGVKGTWQARWQARIAALT